MNNEFLKSFSVLVGTIIGVGLFGLPYITLKSGIFAMVFYFLLLGGVMILSNLMYGEIILRTKNIHRLPGYAGIYLGDWAKRFTFTTNGFGLTAALLAYLIIGGRFLYSLLSPYFGGSNLFYLLLFFSVGSFLIYYGIKSIAKVEMILLLLFFIALIFIFVRGMSLIDLNNFPILDLKYFFLPYGAVLFSLSGASLIPEIREILGKKSRQLKKVILFSILTTALIYFFSSLSF